MKPLLYITFALCTLSILCSCDKEENGQLTTDEARNTLKSMYPSAKSISWEIKNGYIVADFNAPSSGREVEHSAWFDRSGRWYMTETDIPFSALPEAVKTAYQQSAYAEWVVDDVDMIERENYETLYVIEAESRSAGNDTDVDLYYSADGILIKALTDADNDNDYGDLITSSLNESLRAFIENRYPGARILEIDVESRRTEVEIIDGNVCREVIFDTSNVWIRTETETTLRNIPATVQQALDNSIYAGYLIDDVYHIETESGEHYLFELENNGREINVGIDVQGNIL